MLSRCLRAISANGGSLSLNFDSFFLWRQRTTDGLYSQSGMFLRTGQTLPSRYVGATPDLSIAWHVDRHTTVQFLAPHLRVTEKMEALCSIAPPPRWFCLESNTNWS
jgi:hypothetical protein